MPEKQTAVDVGTITKLSHRSVAETVARMKKLVASKGMRLFDVVDQAAEARRVGLELRDTTLVIFGSPQAGTPVMAAVPLAALDLPLKILIWDDSGQTKVTYETPDAIARRRGLSRELAANFAGINALTDALIAR